MDILIVAATPREIEPSRAIDLGDSHSIEFLVTGVGMTATAYQLGKALAKQKPDLLVNVGVCGSFDHSLPLGSIVRVTEDTFSELGAEDGNMFLVGTQLGFGACTYTELIKLDNPVLGQLPTVRGITVNTVHGQTGSIEHIVSRLSPMVESMEGAAVFYAAHQEQIPCLQVRSVSNYVERRNRANWKMDQAIAALNSWLSDFITALPV